ncbi:hypothetical protein [Methylobacterium sp. J-070]|uniref:hypothetical protein n=1 Tax=Methylobacterium sp. J-070 TaxID=2836650 RepID=UPI001FBAF9F4|nr:hypothetical protein [Methylobacterium sp. J-070]MCJ2054135.1 hypothetical protein [Methylobacterium sp. J-070]
MKRPPDADRLALKLEVAELRQRLAAAQEMLVETAIDASQLHARIDSLQDKLARVRADRNAWRAAARASGRAVA